MDHLITFKYKIKCKVNDQRIEDLTVEDGSILIKDYYLGDIDVNEHGDPVVDITNLDNLFCVSDFIEAEKYSD